MATSRTGGRCDLSHKAYPRLAVRRHGRIRPTGRVRLSLSVMEFTQLGHTGLSVSRLALGCMSYGSSQWRPWVLDEDAARPFFRKAVESGINFFDTADMYSLGVSEEVTGRAVRELTNREETVLATKVYWPVDQGPNMSGLSRKHVVQACEASLKRLGVDV